MAENTKIVDARGLSCPQPVLIASDEMDALAGGAHRGAHRLRRQPGECWPRGQGQGLAAGQRN